MSDIRSRAVLYGVKVSYPDTRLYDIHPDSFNDLPADVNEVRGIWYLIDEVYLFVQDPAGQGVLYTYQRP